MTLLYGPTTKKSSSSEQEQFWKDARWTISPYLGKRFEMGKEIEFVGHINSDTGIRPGKKKFATIKQFPMPSCIWDVLAFLGLANQLGSFIPDLAHMTSTIRPLLKEGTTWNWLPEHQTTLKKIKEILTSHMMILPFDPNLDTILLTDASRLHGIGFALIQIKKGNMQLIQCASSSLTATHQSYAVCELECMAVEWSTCEDYHTLKFGPITNL